MDKKKKIMIVDDEEMLCHLIKLNLEATGKYEVLTATDPRDGIKAIHEWLPDLILLDLMMPHMEGSEVAARLMETDDTKNIPIVFLTALAEKTQADQDGFSSGREFVPKPITTGELMRRIEKVLAASGGK
ncbi:MAG: response regulator [Elusimicrobia bacterium]|nr:response regulator [Elusimicrobiota bacterium]